MCKICGQACEKTICDNCLSHLSQLSADDLRRVGCQIKDELSLVGDTLQIDRRVALPVVIPMINVVLPLEDYKPKKDE